VNAPLTKRQIESLDFVKRYAGFGVKLREARALEKRGLVVVKTFGFRMWRVETTTQGDEALASAGRMVP